jgi:23S rRNA pseudouridine2605 synthase
MRLAKYLAHAGIASRRAAEDLIRAGRVRVDGEVVSDLGRQVLESAQVCVDGAVVAGPEERVVWMVNKPAGVVSTARDTHGRPTVVSLVRDSSARLYPVGRLDADTTGLILLTNDGELANRMMHPRYEVPRTYVARVAGGPVGDGAVRALRTGVELSDGRTAPATVRVLGGDRLELVLHEGRKRQVRRMCEAVGHPVTALERIAFGPLRLGGLEPGAHRRLTDAEVEALRAASGEAKPRAAKPPI